MGAEPNARHVEPHSRNGNSAAAKKIATLSYARSAQLTYFDRKITMSASSALRSFLRPSTTDSSRQIDSFKLNINFSKPPLGSVEQ